MRIIYRQLFSSLHLYINASVVADSQSRNVAFGAGTIKSLLLLVVSGRRCGAGINQIPQTPKSITAYLGMPEDTEQLPRNTPDMTMYLPLTAVQPHVDIDATIASSIFRLHTLNLNNPSAASS